MYILNRPIEIIALTGLTGAIGAILLINGIGTGGVELPTAVPSFGSDAISSLTAVMPFLGALEIPLALGFLGSAAGLFLGKSWGWSMSRAMHVLGIVAGFGFLADAAGIVGTMLMYTMAMAISGVVIGYLRTPAVKEFYGKIVVSQLPKKTRRRRRQEVEEESEDIEPSAEIE